MFDSNANCVKELYGKDYKGEEADDVANAVAYGFDNYYALQVGHPIGSAYDLKKLGIFNSEDEIKNYTDKDGNMIQPNAKPGDIKFLDWNEDGVIDEKDRHFIGSPDPLFTLNFGNTISWKNFSLYFNFRWRRVTTPTSSDSTRTLSERTSQVALSWQPLILGQRPITHRHTLNVTTPTL